MDAEQTVSDAVVVKPGDTLIVALEGHGTAENVRRVSEHFKSIIPATVKVIVLDGVRALAVVKGAQNA